MVILVRDPNRIPIICKALEEAWSKHPDLRLGQFLEGANIFPVTTIDFQGVMLPFFQEDHVTLRKLTTPELHFSKARMDDP